jgi:hypothetical protein
MSNKKLHMTESSLRSIVREELINKLRSLKEATEDVVAKESHEISAAASTLKKAIDAFNAEDLPEIPSELSSALSSASSVLDNMADNPGRYKGGVAQAENVDAMVQTDSTPRISRSEEK